MNGRFALVIGNNEYQDCKLSQLSSPAADVDGLSRVLEDQELGAFDSVVKLFNQPKAVIERRISGLFAGKQPDDLVLLYFSGHGVRDEDGQLYLAVSDTDHYDLDSSAVIGSFITRVMNKSSSRRQILILDCCHSGAFSSGFKGAKGEELGTTVDTRSVFDTPGYGRIILTASDSTQYAWEGEQVIGDAESSLYTRFLVQGISTGEADVRGKGRITADELHDYAYHKVVARSSKQRPQRFGAREEGQLILSKAPLRIAELPLDIRNALKNGFPRVRQAAITDLLDLMQTGMPGQILAAHAALSTLLDDDSLSVRKAASEALGSYKASQFDIDQNLFSKPAIEAQERAGRQLMHEEAALSDEQDLTPNAAGHLTQEINDMAPVINKDSDSTSQLDPGRSVVLIVGVVLLATLIISTLIVHKGKSNADTGTALLAQTSLPSKTPSPTPISFPGATPSPTPTSSPTGTPSSVPTSTALNTDSMYMQGKAYYHGKGVSKNYKKAYECYKMAADAGDARAMNDLGILYHNGQGVQKDDNQALFWYSKAADRGNSNAVYNRRHLCIALRSRQDNFVKNACKS